MCSCSAVPTPRAYFWSTLSCRLSAACRPLDSRVIARSSTANGVHSAQAPGRDEVVCVPACCALISGTLTSLARDMYLHRLDAPRLGEAGDFALRPAASGARARVSAISARLGAAERARHLLAVRRGRYGCRARPLGVGLHVLAYGSRVWGGGTQGQVGWVSEMRPNATACW
jgi:hypothetical protein